MAVFFKEFSSKIFTCMVYQEFKPHESLASFIDAYWVMQNDTAHAFHQRIQPDGCIDIIINSGEDFVTHKGSFIMKNESANLVGTMTRFADLDVPPGIHLTGIRFKPLGFSSFYKFSSLHEIANQTIEFEKKLVPETRCVINDIAGTMNHFFSNRKLLLQPSLGETISSAQNQDGSLTVDQLAKRHFISKRQLERNFKRHLGISPKEYLDFVRYQAVFQKIKKNTVRKSLLDIALDSGYYDHAHLTNEVKKYSGCLPSEL